jgi:glutamate dehydrogenase (NAD(P)+)
MTTAADLLPAEIAETELDPYLEAMTAFENAAQQLNLEPWIVDRLKNAEREIVLNLSYSLSGSKHSMFTGFRVLHSSVRGPALGPLCIAPEISLSRVRASAMNTTWQCGLLDLPFGGSSGAMLCDADGLSEAELRTIVQTYIENMGGMISRFEDVVIPRRGCNGQLAGWMMESCGRHGGMPDYAAVTNKPGALWGLSSQTIAAQGLGFLLEQILTDRGATINHQRVIIQGFGSSGSAIARALAAMGARLVGLADISGALYRADGMDLNKVDAHCRDHKMLYGFQDADDVCNADLLEAPADILILAAAENQISRTNAAHIPADIVVEMAERAISSAGHEILNERGVLVVPELLANSTNLVAAFLEWKQGLQFCRLSQQDTREALKLCVEKTWQELREFRLPDGKFNLQQKALQLGISRVAEAVRLLT